MSTLVFYRERINIVHTNCFDDNNAEILDKEIQYHRCCESIFTGTPFLQTNELCYSLVPVTDEA